MNCTETLIIFKFTSVRLQLFRSTSIRNYSSPVIYDTRRIIREQENCSQRRCKFEAKHTAKSIFSPNRAILNSVVTLA